MMTLADAARKLRTKQERATVEKVKPKSQPVVMCHYCGYEPALGTIPQDGRCPKCRGCSWERFTVSDRIFPLHAG